ncbi:hypothetical protein BROUX41_006207 [Berkeleyomyces rouxiae]|uniref:uncharacterized protein n=1 Tax=Berkeleyomyces rouxiae TaxID=2035830 RepID=UPI003B7AA025
MSSMFKKRTGGPAFKPKTGPRARPGPAPSATGPAPVVVASPSMSSASPDTSVSPTSPPSEPQGTPAAPALAAKLPTPETSDLPLTSKGTQSETLQSPPLSQPQPSAITRPRIRPRLLAKKGNASAPAAPTPQAPSSPSQSTGTAIQRSQGKPAVATASVSSSAPPTASGEAVASSAKPAGNTPLISTPEPSGTVSSVATDTQSHTWPALPPTPEPTAPQSAPSLDSLPELHTNVSTPTATDDSHLTPTDSTSVSFAGSDTGASAPIASEAQAARKRKNPATDANGDASSIKRQRKPHATIETDDTTPEVDEATNPVGAAPKPRRRRMAQPSAERRRRLRSETPPDSESQVVDLQKLTMADLTRDLRIGKKFSRHDELKERERRARCKSERARTPGGSQGVGSPAPADARLSSRVPGGTAPSSAAAPIAAGPQFRIVDGQIVVDQESLLMDRHAHAAAEREGMEEIEENDFTRLITSNSFRTGSKLRGPNHWTQEDTEKFYHALKMFGTDFEMISSMFPGRTRRHVKMKFNREERMAPTRINAALVGEKHITVDMEAYTASTGIEYESVEAIHAAQRELAEQHEAEERRIAEDQEAEMRRRREALFCDGDKPKVDANGFTTVDGDTGEGPIFFGGAPMAKMARSKVK